MSERERWIVYPLLFLALGASLRDKIIKTTESQRLKAQGLYVYEEVGNQTRPVLVLGAQQFPDFRSNAGDFMDVDVVSSNSMSATSVSSKSISASSMSTNSIRSDYVVAENIVAKNITLTDGKNNVALQGKTAVPVINRLLIALRLWQQQRAVEQAVEEAGEAASKEVPSESPSEQVPEAESQDSTESIDSSELTEKPPAEPNESADPAAVSAEPETK